MKLNPRFALDIPFVVGGAFLAVAAMSFSAPVAGWVGFGVFTGLAVLAAVSAAAAGAARQRIGHGLLGLVALWALIAALVFSGPALVWLVFADGVALGALALADQAVHEATTEDTVHRLEVAGTDGRTAGRVAA